MVVALRVLDQHPREGSDLHPLTTAIIIRLLLSRILLRPELAGFGPTVYSVLMVTSKI